MLFNLFFNWWLRVNVEKLLCLKIEISSFNKFLVSSFKFVKLSILKLAILFAFSLKIASSRSVSSWSVPGKLSNKLFNLFTLAELKG
ncbi:Uncharacterised protein [Mycoplasmopsis maculosa]|uniref:Uncharacterized protein n=1 Tax=Mycoplasmopsis maculosa TaxID=114885 RepID=A0A449B3W0_9BACT|nr:hypothetical protein [Mycoplasmopsis maculosa]VEU75259.1 Uncharacterised protein [Mycoplasmopsis maculosa]